ncbi:MAG: Gfo/Idh/MocA family oxidoreductase [bacterium]
MTFKIGVIGVGGRGTLAKHAHHPDAGVDAVVIATPDWLHEEHAVAALERGLAVYLEKPMAITITGCDRILRTAKQQQARLFVGHNMRYMTIIRKMKQLIDAGTIGKVKTMWCRHFISYGGDAYFRDWHADRQCSTGLLLQKGAHDIDVMHWLAGSYSRRVTAFGSLAVYGDLPRRTELAIDKKEMSTWWNQAH